MRIIPSGMKTSSEEEALRRALGLGLADLGESFGGYLAARLGVSHRDGWRLLASTSA